MCVKNISIHSNIKEYHVAFEEDTDFLKELSQMDDAVFIIDENVFNLHREGCLQCIPKERIILLEIHENKKNISTVCELYEKIMGFELRKNLNLVSIGGGITQDITGFVASSLYRGVNWIFIPTTLLAQVDSCIGAKTSLNFKQYKNLVGTFYPPTKIHIYPEFLKTLSREDYYSGIGEMAKLHLMDGEQSTKDFIIDLNALDTLDMSVLLRRIQLCLSIKKSYIENDEFDKGMRNMLNYGHCFGHAIESASSFSISHGQAVVVGMILANAYAAKIGILNKETEIYIRQNALNPILVVPMPVCDVNIVTEAMQQDKKNIGSNLALVMLTDNYVMHKITDLTKEQAVETYNDVTH